MSKDILTDARLYLVGFLRGKSNDFEVRHPWRKDWKFAVLHSLRVEACVLRILALEQHSLSQAEISLLRLAAILHDIARLDQRQKHAQAGAEISREWLLLHPEYLLTGVEIERVTQLIAIHSDKGGPEPDFCAAVLKDADTLDEIGAMSIFMSSNWLESRSPFFFHDLRRRLIEFELPYCEEKLKSLRTRGARQILGERRIFIEGFISQLTDELEMDGDVERLLAGNPRNDG